MPRLSSLLSKLTSAGAKKTPVFIKIFTGTDFSAYHSTWTFSTGTISLVSSTLPYHSYGNSAGITTATNQGCDRMWSLRAGTFLGTELFVNVSNVSSGSFVTTETEILTIGMPIVFDVSIRGSSTSSQFYVKSIGTGSFTVSPAIGAAPLIFSTSTSMKGTVAIASSSTGNIGYWVNGVNILGPSAGTEAPNGYLSFDHLNYNSSYAASFDFSYDLGHDLAGGLVSADGNYHYQDFSFAEAWTTGTAHVGTGTKVVTTGTAEISLIPYYSGTLKHADGHSKILGWSLDGYPIYGPFGYNQAFDHNSGVRPMKSSYKTFSSPSRVIERVQDGVLDSFDYPMGMFVQDYYYDGTGDLDIFNGRNCVTPEYPQGTYAYFCTVDSTTGRGVYPYVIGKFHKSIPLQGSQTASTATNGGGLAPKQTG